MLFFFKMFTITIHAFLRVVRLCANKHIRPVSKVEDHVRAKVAEQAGSRMSVALVFLTLILSRPFWVVTFEYHNLLLHC